MVNMWIWTNPTKTTPTKTSSHTQERSSNKNLTNPPNNILLCSQTGSFCPKTKSTIAVAFGWERLILLLDHHLIIIARFDETSHSNFANLSYSTVTSLGLGNPIGLHAWYDLFFPTFTWFHHQVNMDLNIGSMLNYWSQMVFKRPPPPSLSFV